MIEQRKDARLGVSIPVDFQYGHAFFEGRTEDVSLGGLFIATNVALPVGTFIDLHMELTSVAKPRAFRTSAEVMWLRRARDGTTQGVGVRFLLLPNTARRAFEVFMALRQPDCLDKGNTPRLRLHLPPPTGRAKAAPRAPTSIR